MPFQKRRKVFRKRGRRYRSSVKPKTWSGLAWDMAKRAATGIVKAYVNTEQKYLDQAPSSSANMGTVGLTYSLSQIPLGDGPSNREGRQVKATSLTLKAVLALNASATSDVIRLIIVQCQTPTAATLTNVLVSANTIAPRNLNLVRDYKVIWDKTFSLDQAKNQIQQVNEYIPLNSKLQYNVSDTAGQSNSVWGEYFLLGIAREVTNESSVTFWSRLRYIDN